jgi:hypothetical protein
LEERSCTILILGHLPSRDNLEGLRSRDLSVDSACVANWRSNIVGAIPLLRCFASLVSITFCPASLRHAQSARLLTETLAISDPFEDERLNNIDYGIFKGRPVTETPPMTDTPHIPYEGGESWNDVASKWGEFCREELSKHNRGIVLLAGQSATAVRMLRHFCDHVPLSQALSEEVPNIPFFSPGIDFSTRNLVWRYTWTAD